MMVIKELVNLYEALVEQGKVASMGWTDSKVTYGLELDKNGIPKGLKPLAVREVESKKGKRIEAIPAYVMVPEQKKRTNGVNPYLLCDTAGYLLGVSKNGKDAIKYFNASKKNHLKFLKGLSCDAASAVIKFFQQWNPDSFSCYDFLLEKENELATVKIVFLYNGEPVSSDKEIVERWQELYESQYNKEEKITCIITGKKEPQARNHKNIMNIANGASMGQPLVSNDKQAFWSYNREKADGIGIGMYTAHAYTTALNYLLKDHKHVVKLGKITAVGWLEGGDPAEEKIFEVFQNAADVWTEKNEKINMERKFFLLGLSPNSGRLVVNFFLENSFGNFLSNVNDFRKDFFIELPEYVDTDKEIPLWRILKQTLPPGSKEVAVTERLPLEMLTAIYNKQRYPEALINGVMKRIRAEQKVSYEKAAIIKGYYTRNGQCPREVLGVDLNEECEDIPYILGRIFAVCEHLQEKAIPGVKSTITMRFFNTAYMVPARVYPTLLKMSSWHLKKLKKDAERIYFDSMLSDLLNKIGGKFPQQLTFEQQGCFMLGYYFQRKKRFSKRKVDKDE